MNNKKTTYMTKSDIVLQTLQNKKFGEPKPIKEEESTYSEYNKRIDDIYSNKEKVFREYKEFEVRVKEDFLMECMCKILIPSFDKLVDTPRKESICKGLVKDFIKEETVDGLLNEFKKGSSLLYELYDITNRYSKAVFERCDKNNCNTFNVDTDIKDEFFTELEEGDLNKVSDTLNARISNALDEFITDNLETKSQIQDIINQTQERIDANKNMKEAYNETAERQIVELKRNRSKGVLEGMIYNVTESCILDDEMKSIYFENGKLNLDKVVEETALLYGFLEMVNLCYMKKVDEQYILDNINGLKK